MAKKQINIFENELLSRQGEIIIPVGFGNYERTTRRYSHDWFKLKNNPNFMFKPQDNYGEDIDGEIIYGMLAQMNGLPAVNIIPAVQTTKEGMQKKGLAIQHFASGKNQRVVTAASILLRDYYEIENNIQSHMEGIDVQVRLNQNEGILLQVEQNLEEKLFTMCVLDFLSLNLDRHKYNISYIITEHNKNKFSIELSKVYDNGYAFMFGRTNKEMQKNLPKYIKNKMMDKMRFFVTNQNKPIVQQLAHAIKSNSNYAKIYNKIRRTNFDLVGEKINQKYPNYKISDKKLSFAKQIFKTMIGQLDKEIQNAKIVNKTQKQNQIEDRIF